MLLEELQAGYIDSLVIQDPFKMGETAVTTAIRAIKRERTPKNMFLPPRLIEAADLHNPEVQAQVHPNFRKYLNSPGS